MSGLEERYLVRRLEDPEGRHEKCEYFVLDPKHDPHARTALLAYAKSVRHDFPTLYLDLMAMLTRAFEAIDREEVAADGQATP